MRGCVLALVALSGVALPATVLAAPDAAARRVIVGGPEGDPIAARVQKELAALGFETLRLGALDGCARAAVTAAATEKDAAGAACSDGDQVGVWVSDGRTLRLRDVVVARDEGERGREVTAVRAAEITRAALALRGAEEESAAATAGNPAPPPAPAGAWGTIDEPDVKPPPKPEARRSARFAASAGMSALMGIDASAGAFSGQVGVGVHRYLTATARLDYPVESHDVGGPASGALTVAPALAAVGAELPLAAASSFIIPRLGAGVGIAWLRAVREGGVAAPLTSTATAFAPSSDGVASPGAFASASVSMRILGPVRLMAEAAFGATVNRLVVRDQGRDVAYWGQPFGALSLRLELMIR